MVLRFITSDGHSGRRLLQVRPHKDLWLLAFRSFVVVLVSSHVVSAIAPAVKDGSVLKALVRRESQVIGAEEQRQPAGPSLAPLPALAQAEGRLNVSGGLTESQVLESRHVLSTVANVSLPLANLSLPVLESRHVLSTVANVSLPLANLPLPDREAVHGHGAVLAPNASSVLGEPSFLEGDDSAAWGRRRRSRRRNCARRRVNSGNYALCSAAGAACTCKGRVRFGFGQKYIEYDLPVEGEISCSQATFYDCDVFGGDTKRRHCLCKQDCVWKEWEDWARCPVTCGGGDHSRKRLKVQDKKGPGEACKGKSSESRRCGESGCPTTQTTTMTTTSTRTIKPKDCVWADWAEWSMCQKGAEGLCQQTRKREIKDDPVGLGKACDKVDGGKTDESEVCQCNVTTRLGHALPLWLLAVLVQLPFTRSG